MSQVQMPTTPDWLNDCIIEGLQMLLTLRLRNAPAVDTINNVIDIWLVLFTNKGGWDEGRDYARIRQAFLKVASKLNEWPAPAQVFDAMPPLPVLPSLTTKVKCTLPRVETERMMGEMKLLLSRWAVKQPRQMSATEMHQKVQEKLKEKS